MKVVAAYLLAALGGNATPSAEDISKILSSGEELLKSGCTMMLYVEGSRRICSLSRRRVDDEPPTPPSPDLLAVGIEADSERVATLLKEVDGKDINEVSS